MFFIFADDSRQNGPTRAHVRGRMIGVGGFAVESSRLLDLERGLDDICRHYGFPAGCEFKWSPPRNNWMSQHLIEDQRRDFFQDVLAHGVACGIQSCVVVEDVAANPADADTHEQDALQLFLERMTRLVASNDTTAVVIADEPGGGEAGERAFLHHCLELREEGAGYVHNDALAITVLCAKSHFVRCLQLADLITSCTTARVAGEQTYAPQTFQAIVPLLLRGTFGCGGTGLKIHPDLWYLNLYHWLLGDDEYGTTHPMPLPEPRMLYALSEWE